MFSRIGVPELLLILAIVLLIFGPKNLPKLGKSIGRAVENFKKGQQEAGGEEDDDDEEERSAAESPKTKKAGSKRNSSDSDDE